MYNMDLEKLRSDLTILGNVGMLIEKNDELFISIEKVEENVTTIITFNNILKLYDSIWLINTFSLESNSIKAIYKRQL